MGRTIRSLLAAVLVCCAAARADVAFSATAGSFTEVGDGWDGFNHDYSATVWHVFDQMVLFGVTAGMQIDGGVHQFPLLASLYVRLPLGRQLLPVATGDFGWVFGDGANECAWRVGGGLDLKLGDRSSLLLLAGSQMGLDALPTRAYLRGGILLEF